MLLSRILFTIKESISCFLPRPHFPSVPEDCKTFSSLHISSYFFFTPLKIIVSLVLWINSSRYTSLCHCPGHTKLIHPIIYHYSLLSVFVGYVALLFPAIFCVCILFPVHPPLVSRLGTLLYKGVLSLLRAMRRGDERRCRVREGSKGVTATWVLRLRGVELSPR